MVAVSMDSFMYRAIAVRAALKLARNGLKPYRGFTYTKALAICTTYTGRKYRRTDAATAIDDMTVFIERTKATPIHRS